MTTTSDTAISPTLATALAKSMDTGHFLDTKFYVFTRRQKSGEVDLPKAIYANSYILKKRSSYFNDCQSRFLMTCLTLLMPPDLYRYT